MQRDPNPYTRVPEFAELLRAFYGDLDRRIDELLSAFPGSGCRECGECCTFPAGVPVLYVTSIEHAYLASGPPPPQAELPEGQCPYFERETKFCTARGLRPAMCRTHFCDDSMTGKEARIAAENLAAWAQDELRKIANAQGLEWRHMSVLDSRP